MMRVNFLLFFVLVVCASSVVISQDHARGLFIQLEQAQEQAKQMDVEYGKLQLEQSTWANHARVEQIATTQLNMKLPDTKQVQIVTVPRGQP